MTNVLAPFPSYTTVVRALILDAFPQITSRQVGEEIVDNIATRLPYVMLGRLPGGRNRLNDYPALDVDVFASTIAGAESLAEALDARLLGYPHVVEVDGITVVLDGVEVNSSPAPRPPLDGEIERFGAVYTFSVRRR